MFSRRIRFEWCFYTRCPVLFPRSGKSTTSDYVAELLKAHSKVCYVDEGTGDHPADYEFYALALLA